MVLRARRVMSRSVTRAIATKLSAEGPREVGARGRCAHGPLRPSQARHRATVDGAGRVTTSTRPSGAVPRIRAMPSATRRAGWLCAVAAIDVACHQRVAAGGTTRCGRRATTPATSQLGDHLRRVCVGHARERDQPVARRRLTAMPSTSRLVTAPARSRRRASRRARPRARRVRRATSRPLRSSDARECAGVPQAEWAASSDAARSTREIDEPKVGGSPPCLLVASSAHAVSGQRQRRETIRPRPVGAAAVRRDPREAGGWHVGHATDRAAARQGGQRNAVGRLPARNREARQGCLLPTASAYRRGPPQAAIGATPAAGPTAARRKRRAIQQRRHAQRRRRPAAHVGRLPLVAQPHAREQEQASAGIDAAARRDVPRRRRDRSAWRHAFTAGRTRLASGRHPSARQR